MLHYYIFLVQFLLPVLGVSSFISTDKASYTTNDTIVVTFGRPTGATTTDWLSVTDRGQVPPSIVWQYACGGTAACGEAVADGAVSFPADGLDAGDYDVTYLNNGSNTVLDGPVGFTVRQVIDDSFAAESYLSCTFNVTSVEINSGAFPGYLILSEARAFPLVLASDTAVFGAASTFQDSDGVGTGRVAGFAHGSFISGAADDSSLSGLATMMRNLAKWVGQSSHPSVALQAGDSALRDLAAVQFGDFTVAELSDANVLAGSLSGYNVLFADADHYSTDEEVSVLRAFVASGGGVIFFGTPW
jgi:hypothetical protein